MSLQKSLLNGEVYQNLKTLIETLTHSGLKTLDENLFKELKRICKLSPMYVEKVYSLILYQLKKKHSEIRFLAFQICVELFKRSALFRELIIRDLKLIFELTAETNQKKKLPPPKIVAENLIKLALSTIQNWVDEFGETYKELQIAFHYLKHVKHVNFQLMRVNNEIDLQRQKHLKTLKEEKMKKVLEEIDSNELEIENAITALNNCLSLLVPSPDNFFINVDNDIKSDGLMPKDTNSNFESINLNNENFKDEGVEINLKHFGITNNYSISVDSGVIHNKICVKYAEENSSLIQNAEDNVKLMKNRFLPLVKKWSQACIKYSEDNGAALRKIVLFKEKMETSIAKYKKLYFKNHSESESDTDNEFEEVTKEHYESLAPLINDKDISFSVCTSKKSLKSDWGISVGEECDPTSAKSTLKRLEERNEILNRKIDASSDTHLPATNLVEVNSSHLDTVNRKHKLLASAPTLPFDIDLYHWEDQNLTPPTLLSKQMDSAQFWAASTEEFHEIPNPEGIAALRMRVIEFSGKFEPVKWSCRAPLPNGKLCPRKDRFKCPFHGRIVARDENGVCQQQNKIAQPTSVKDIGKFDFSSEDREFLEDLKRATGVDLTIPHKKEQSKTKRNVNKTYKKMETSSSTLKTIEARNFPGLTDIVGKQNNAYKRISKKIFKRSSLNKVASTLDKIDYIKHRDKFGDQFNYVYET